MGIEKDDGALPEWAEWKGEGPAPTKWWATNPETDERVLVYRDYEAYCMD